MGVVRRSLKIYRNNYKSINCALQVYFMHLAPFLLTCLFLFLGLTARKNIGLAHTRANNNLGYTCNEQSLSM